MIIDRARMDKALNADRVALPKGLNKEQIHEFLLRRAGKQMNWQKYTIKGWVAQYGAWCNQNTHQRTGNLPKITRPNWLGEYGGVGKVQKVCEISDLEAYHVSQLLMRAREILPEQVEMLCMNAMCHLSIRRIAEIKGVNKTFVKEAITNAQYYLLGLNPNLRLE